MRWKGHRRSTNVEDRRGKTVSGGLKIGGLGIIAIFVIGLIFGENPLQLLNMLTGPNSPLGQTQSTESKKQDDEASAFIKTILASTEDTWNKVLPQQADKRYRAPKLVLFNRQVKSTCGFATAATGPFYCPADNNVYIDLSFFHELKRMGASGDFAQAYVLGHEVGHHIQNLLGTTGKIDYAQRRTNRTNANKLSVLLELQADCYAGVWAHHSEKQKRWLDEGDLEEGLQAAAAIGDDRLQSSAGRQVNPDAFTHGTSKQRAHWLTIGLKFGDMQRCDTFTKQVVR